MAFICSNCNKLLNKVVSYRREYYVCKFCGHIIENSAIYSSLDKNLVKLLSYENNIESDKTSYEESPIKWFLDSTINHLKNYESLEFSVVEDFIDVVLGSNNVFIEGFGRSGLVGRGFIMKLTKLGLKSFAYCEISSPPIKRDDCLIALSGSGKTKKILESVKEAKKRGCKTLSLTNNANSPLAKLSDIILIIDGEEPFITAELEERLITGEYIKIAPMGTLFELTSMIILDGLIGELALRLNKNEHEKDEEFNYNDFGKVCQL
ncbi:MAG: SIS domain-containing protein [Methanobrevibacter sp.]|jgi:6-phospho 3-hexuloisomerase|nr:SIS domain-containing protein [Candidatus Methanovirga aequatorialis]